MKSKWFAFARIRIIIAVLIVAAFLPQFSTPAFAGLSWKYTAVGDSLGYGLWGFNGLAIYGYVPRYRDFVEQDTAVAVQLTNLSQLGWTSGQLLDALRTNASYRDSIKHSQIVSWDIGGNDFLRARDSYKAGTCGGALNRDCLAGAIALFKANWTAILQELTSLRNPRNTMMRTMDFYNPYVTVDSATYSGPDKTVSDFQVFKPYLDDLNTYIHASTAAYGIPAARVYAAFNGACGCEDPVAKGYISFDGLHPTTTGHRVIAGLFRALGYAPLPR